MVAPSASWSGSYARDPVVYAPGPPSLAPTAVPVSNTAGYWLIAVCSWRQDAGTAGTLQYPSTVSISDDAANFWIPVYSGVPAQASSSSPSTGIVRCAVWMAPAARTAQYVFFAPTAYQSSLVAQVFQFDGVCPWYQVDVVAGGFVNQYTALSAVSGTIPTGVQAFGVVAYDNTSASVTITASGWTALTTASVSNGTDHTGDMYQAGYYLVGTGASESLSASSSTTMDWAGIVVAVSGIADARAFPYSIPLEDWPVVVTEISAGPALNTDPVFASGATYWTSESYECTVTAVTWPLFQPIPSPYQPALYGSVLVTPSGTNSSPQLVSNLAPVSSLPLQYTAVAWIYSPPGFGNTQNGTGFAAGISWYNASEVYISSTYSAAYTPAPPGEWTQLTVESSFPPAGAAYGTAVVIEYGGSVSTPVAAHFYAGFCAFSVVQAYEATPPDEISWTDISSRVFTQGQIQVTRGIQYEQQSLEAGTMTLYVSNNDGAFTFGNVLSQYWPEIGDTDVPIRQRLIWPGSLTPYVVLFSGYTDDIVFGVNADTYYGYAQIQCSDSWSRLTQQMLAVVENESLIDNPVAFISCNQTGANSVSTGAYANPAEYVLATTGNNVITSYPTASFTGGAITVAGATGLSCWQSGDTQTAETFGGIGYCLVWLPSQPLPVSQGLTVEFWFCPVSYWSDQAETNVTVCQALGGATGGADESSALWTLAIDNGDPGADSFQSFLVLTTPSGTYTVGNLISFYATTALATANYYIVVSWTETQISVTVNPGDPEVTETITETQQSIGPECTGFSWGGVINPPQSNPYGFGDTAIADISVFEYVVPPARSAARYYAGLTAFGSDSDNYRLARVTGYAGFVPVLGMRCTDLAVPPSAGVDLVTGATDTNTQVVSAYFTNEAQSTLAVLFVNGAGTLVYRRRDEWYDRPLGQWVLGEHDAQFLSLGINPLNASSSTSGWTTQNGATLTSSEQTAAGPLFVPFCGLLHGNGSSLNPQIGYTTTGDGPAVTPGVWYTTSLWVYSPQGFSTGLGLYLQFYSSGGSAQNSAQYNLPALAAGGLAFMTVTGQAGDLAASVVTFLYVNGTPASTVQFYVADVQLYSVSPEYAGGPGVVVPEAPYSAGYQVSSDRSQLYNYAQLTQYGTNLVSSFSGTSVLFTPSSGVVVTITNQASVDLRGQVPYTATLYLNNTSQATPYYLNEGSMEDFGSWITQTLGSPLVHPGQVTITPVATPAALAMGLLAEVGDTVLFRRRALGAPAMQYLCYLSQITTTIDISGGTWSTQYQLSPFPGGSILQCDSVVNGVIDGTSLLGW